VTGVAYKVPDTLYMYKRYDQTMLTQTSEIANRNRCSSLYKSFNTSSYYGKTGPLNLQETHHEKTVLVTSAISFDMHGMTEKYSKRWAKCSI